jgi:hypothetical protein
MGAPTLDRLSDAAFIDSPHSRVIPVFAAHDRRANAGEKPNIARKYAFLTAIVIIVTGLLAGCGISPAHKPDG